MHDWRKMVHERVTACGLPPANYEEVISELAAHLDETYEDARSQGLTDPAALELTLQEVNDWHVLAANIRRSKSKEDPMNNRTKSLWLPAMANLAVAAGLLMILQKLGVQPRVVWIGDMAMVLYLPWLITLPVFGAAGSLLARQAQAPSAFRLVAGLAPSLAILGSFLVILPLSFAIDRHQFVEFPFGYFALTIFNWVLLPACALLLGTLPFLREADLREI